MNKNIRKELFMSDNTRNIIERDKARMAAMAAKDIAALKEMLADDLIYTHSSSRLDTKASLIGGMESGSTVYKAAEPRDVEAQDLGDAVILTGAAHIEVSAGGADLSFDVRFTDVWAKRDGAWRMVAWQSTKLP